MTSRSARVLADSLDKLQLTKGTDVSSTHSKPQTADSWEDEAIEDSTLADKQAPTQLLSSPPSDFPDNPPTSPVSPSFKTKSTSSGSPFQTFPPFGMNGSWEAETEEQTGSRRTDPDRRPEKTTSVASRLIAAGIGQKPPRRTQEQRDYDQAIKVQEKRKRDAVKEEALKSQQEKEKARLAVWED